jgi:hypothetical protein
MTAFTLHFVYLHHNWITPLKLSDMHCIGRLNKVYRRYHHNLLLSSFSALYVKTALYRFIASLLFVV